MDQMIQDAVKAYLQKIFATVKYIQKNLRF